VKVIFLDFDGVLVNRRSWYVRSGRTATADPPCVAALNRITDSTNAQIVVSSTWRIGMTIVELRNLLHAWGVTGAVLAKTPHMGFSVRRGSEIKAWIDMYEASRELVESFAIRRRRRRHGRAFVISCADRFRGRLDRSSRGKSDRFIERFCSEGRSRMSWNRRSSTLEQLSRIASAVKRVAADKSRRFLCGRLQCTVCSSVIQPANRRPAIAGVIRARCLSRAKLR
jgi:hypothetical protein